MLSSRLYVAFSFGSSKPKSAAETVDERVITAQIIEGLKSAYINKGIVYKTVQRLKLPSSENWCFNALANLLPHYHLGTLFRLEHFYVGESHIGCP